ncbi:hypothetical protein TH59_04695 [Pantoea ananatis]|uniref:hypothetical protein n=1 Tax=Pantoea ananas TaxID=553 RepID=UPI00235049F8|nr:hypothetical protein [Pantoea ananatis]MDC7864245.1 hypothetical protein [Pantoea ananatis]
MDFHFLFRESAALMCSSGYATDMMFNDISGEKMTAAAYFDALYAQRNRETQQCWRQETASAHQQADKFFYPAGLHALTSGIQPVLNPQIQSLLADLRGLTQGDPLADVMRAEHFHVTFLPVTPARYQSPQQLPALAGLRDAFRQNVTDSSLRVDALRLVALPDQLLLAGIPEGHAVAQRASCWNALLSLEEWRDLLLQRHGGKTTPPEYWHTTLLRYRSTSLPDTLKSYFTDNMHRRYGAISGDIRLVFAVYNWSVPETITV